MKPQHCTSAEEPTSKIKIWWSALRPQTLAAGVVPVMVGAAVAYAERIFDASTVIMCVFGALLLQITSNFANDAFDYLNGADTEDRIGPARATQRGWVSPKQMLTATAIAAIAAIAVGWWLIDRGGMPIALIGISGLVCAIAYTAGPAPLGYLGLGDVLVFVFFGLAAVAGTVWAQSPGRAISTTTWLSACATGSLATAILVVNNLRDRHTDAATGKRTLAVRFGAKAARWQWSWLIIASYVCAAIAAWIEGQPAWLLPLVTIPMARKVGVQIWTQDGADLNRLLGATAKIEVLYGVSLSAGLGLSRMWTDWGMQG
ncbi:MAG: 1,4-dihydroxy-2-naphthoate polyprenyltransferase [Myxococcales bacterium]|nr:1,4-dihydroxy-2-naphthoate polyprenyltransferase [Myxococcales bacterium]